MQWIRSHMSFANLVSLMALFVALGGTTYAAVALPKNSVGAKQIKRNGVRAPEINRNAVGASEIRSNAVASGDIADSSVGTSRRGGRVARRDRPFRRASLNFPSITAQTEVAAVALANNSSASYTRDVSRWAAGNRRRRRQRRRHRLGVHDRHIVAAGDQYGHHGAARSTAGRSTGWRVTVLNPLTRAGWRFPGSAAGRRHPACGLGVLRPGFLTKSLSMSMRRIILTGPRRCSCSFHSAGQPRRRPRRRRRRTSR